MTIEKTPNKDGRVPLWVIKGLEKEQAKESIVQYENSKKILSRLKDHIKKSIESSYLDEENLEEISVVNVAEKIGYRKGLREVYDLLRTV